MKRREELYMIISKLSGNSTPGNDEFFFKWLSISDENRLIYEEAKKIWESSSVKLAHPNPSTEQEWEKLIQRIQNSEKSRKLTPSFAWIAFAASGLFFALAGVLVLFKPVAPEPSITIAASSEVMSFFLPDSSKVWLNVNSKLSYPENFLTSGRRVMLDGEAYFVVTSKNRNEFTVSTLNANVVVLGTEFNVRADDSSSTVSVTKGRVRMENKASSVELKKGESGTSSGDELRTRQSTNTETAWRLLNNPVYQQEKKLPGKYLINRNTQRKGGLSQTVIEGTLENSASLAIYRSIQLKISYKKPNGKISTVYTTVSKSIKPGETVTYVKRLTDIFSRDKSVTIEIANAEVVSF
jgi:transmembrane sensor